MAVMNATRLALALIVTMTVSSPIAAQQAAPQVSVEAVLARNVVDRVPSDTGITFTADVGSVSLWMRATGADGQVLHHVWFHGEKELGNVPLTISGSPWRAWTRKTITPDMTGAWHVEIRDHAGTVLKRIDFTVQ
jgi:hypothetical protein